MKRNGILNQETVGELTETPDDDFLLSPAYNLICTRLHISDWDMALEGGLFMFSSTKPQSVMVSHCPSQYLLRCLLHLYMLMVPIDVIALCLNTYNAVCFIWI